MIRILHLSDFHYREKHDADFKSISKSIAKALINQKIDLVIFSGDLVHDANNYKKIEDAANCIIEPIKEITGLKNSHILIAPGNHDMKRGAELSMVKDAFSQYNSYEQIDEYCSQDEQLNLSIENFKNFNKFILKFYEGVMYVGPLYTYNAVTISNKKIGLIAFNSAWRSTNSKEDRGRLVFPTFMVREAFNKVSDCDLVFCTQHHSLTDYTDSVCQQIEDTFNEKCHILFTGHYHKNSIKTTHDAETGLLHLIAPATYNRDDLSSKYGFSILEFDEESLEGLLKIYSKVKDDFIITSQKTASVPISEEKRELNKFRKLIKKRYLQSMESADALFISGKKGVFSELFKDPIIKNKSLQEIITTRKEGESFSLSNIVDNQKSAIIFGYNKKGKSSLLRRIELNILDSCVSRKIIPFLVDYKKYKNGRELDLKQEMHEFLEMNRRKVEDLFMHYTLLVLVDDLEPANNRFITNLCSELNKFNTSFFIATATESMSKQCSLINFEGTDLDKYYIHDITNKEVHQLTLSWPNIAREKKRDIEEKILQISKNMHLSLNYWTVSLFLWIFEKTDNTNIHNNFELVKLYIDELLGKEDFIKSQEFNVDYDDLKSYLAALAEKILYSDDYTLTEAELVEFTETYKKNNLKFFIETWNLIPYLLNNGIIHKIEEKYTIRLKGVFEFLLALRMCENEELKKHVLEDKHAFLSFGNELEYYAGFKKNDFDTISKVFESAKTILEPFVLRPEYEIIDDRLDNTVSITELDEHCTGSMIDRLNLTTDVEEQQELLYTTDTVIDETGIKIKKYHTNVQINSVNLENILFILSRIYRNSNVCNNRTLAKEMFDYILTGTCNLGFLIVDEGRKSEKNNDDNVEQWVKIVSNFMPIILETFIYDAISQKNLSEVFKQKLNELISNPINNQLRIFLLTFILVDLDFKTNYFLIEKALKIIDNKIIRYAILNKNILLSIKYSDNNDIKNILTNQRKTLLLEFSGLSKINDEVHHKIQQKINKETHFDRLRKSDYK